MNCDSVIPFEVCDPFKESENETMKVRLGIGVGTEPSIHWALAADLGDCIQHRMTDSKDEMKSLYDIIMNSGKSFACGEWTPRAKEIPTMEEMTSRCAFASEEFQEIIKRAGNKYLGRQILGEFGGNVFWPYRYLKQPISEGGGGYGLLPEADSMLSAAQNFIVKAREHIKLEQAYGCGPFFVTDSGMLFKYLLKAAEG